MKKIVLIANPIAGSYSFNKIQETLSILKKISVDVELRQTRHKGDAEVIAKELVKMYKADELIVIACGGDGTYNEVANGLAYSEIAMGILPIGTTSVLAKELNIPHSIANALDIALHSTPKYIHMGKINLHHKGMSRYFLLMVGIGFDADVVSNTSIKLKSMIGKAAYVLSILQILAKKKLYQIDIKINGLPSYRCCSAVIGKASLYGGRFTLTPNTSLYEPIFSIYALHNCSNISLIKVFGQMLLNKLPKGTYFKSDLLQIEGTAAIQIDGDYIGESPASIEIAQNALKLAV